MEDNNKKKRNVLVIGIVFTIIILIGSVYAFYNYRKTVEAFTLTSSGITAKFTEGTNEIEFGNAYPISDEFAISNLDKLKYVDFTITGNAINPEEAIKYEIYLTEKDSNTLSNEFIKLYLTDENGSVVAGPVKYSDLENTTYPSDNSNGKVIYQEKQKGEFTKQYRLYMWLDSEYSQNDVSETFSFYVNLYAYNDTSNGIYTVTFDYNDGVTENTTKQVNYGQEYGALPTPTRDNYGFIGWRGKNLFDMEEWLNNVTRVTRGNFEIKDNAIKITATKNDAYTNTYGQIDSYQIRVNPNTTYTFSWQSDSSKGGYVCVFENGKTTSGYGHFANNESINQLTFTTLTDTVYINVRFGVLNNGDSITYTNMQLEEGTIATKYEALFGYVTSSTRVTQENDHTLRAVWGSKHTVTFDYNDGVTESTTKQVIYGQEYGPLPTPIRDGYTFMGWHGKNLFNMEEWLNNVTKVTRGNFEIKDNAIKITATENDAYTETYGQTDSYQIRVEPNTTYTFSWQSNSLHNGYIYVFINGKVLSDYCYYQLNANKKITFTSSDDAEYINVRFGVSFLGNSITYTDMQLELGDHVTEYEPYYIKSDTKVVQNKDHTLKAIWKKNT